MSPDLSEHELQRWLERNRADLVATNVTAVLGRGPTLGSRRGATWISFQSKHTLARVVLSADGRCDFSATNTADGSGRWDATEQFTSNARLDDAMEALVGQLT